MLFPSESANKQALGLEMYLCWNIFLNHFVMVNCMKAGIFFATSHIIAKLIQDPLPTLSIKSKDPRYIP